MAAHLPGWEGGPSSGSGATTSGPSSEQGRLFWPADLHPAGWCCWCCGWWLLVLLVLLLRPAMLRPGMLRPAMLAPAMLQAAVQ